MIMKIFFYLCTFVSGIFGAAAALAAIEGMASGHKVSEGLSHHYFGGYHRLAYSLRKHAQSQKHFG